MYNECVPLTIRKVRLIKSKANNRESINNIKPPARMYVH